MVGLKKKVKQSLYDRFHKLSFRVKIEIEILFAVYLILLGMYLFHKIEGWRYFDALYFVVTMVGGVWFGDFTPKTDMGKLLSIFYITLWVPLFIYAGALLIEKKIKEK